jgi:hypothetical protein
MPAWQRFEGVRHAPDQVAAPACGRCVELQARLEGQLAEQAQHTAALTQAQVAELQAAQRHILPCSRANARVLCVLVRLQAAQLARRAHT